MYQSRQDILEATFTAAPPFLRGADRQIPLLSNKSIAIRSGSGYHDEALEDLAIVIGNAKTRVSLPSWTYRYLGEGSTSAELPLSLEKVV
jgi:hypothetical protein